jgi:hypothetical protein
MQDDAQDAHKDTKMQVNILYIYNIYILKHGKRTLA